MPQNHPLPGEIYLHFKNKKYQVVAIATHSETREPYVVYQALYDDFRTYIRPYDMFISPVDHEKYPHVTSKYRFTYLGTSAVTDAKRQEETVAPEEEQEMSGVPAFLLAFLDEDSYAKKLEILDSMGDVLDDHMINQLAASLDLIIEDGCLEDRLQELRYCIRTKARFEGRR